ncbi:hypothetical protein AMR72_09675 [Flavobacterium psychrophilum]|nr:hypothetical protein AMR72_09675 [Flavobacterium psychrophilum]AOE52751.1 hypothetical protein ALW18_09665 [Flavobacterium psychrophilum]
MKTKNILIAFAVTALVQLFIPLKMIYDSYITETEGVEYHFKARPIDPNDPFRGKFITLDFELEAVATNDTTWQEGDTAYIILAKDENGFAEGKAVSREKPDGAVDYLTAKAKRLLDNSLLFVSLPFDRYYMEESKAPAAESAYFKYAANQDYKPVYAVVAVRKGNSVLKDLIINGMPIREYVIKNRDKNKNHQ